MNKFERAKNNIVKQDTTFVAKSERLKQGLEILKQLDPSLVQQTRQKYEGDVLGTVIQTKDVMTLLSRPEFSSQWGVVPLDKLVEWAWAAGYTSFSELKNDFRLIPLAESDCTIEVACDPARTDISEKISQEGLAGLASYLSARGEKIATDTPAIAEYFFGPELLIKLSGSLEALPKSFAPVIIGIVGSGNSLREEGWQRLAEEFPQAVLLRSQLMMVIKKSGSSRDGS